MKIVVLEERAEATGLHQHQLAGVPVLLVQTGGHPAHIIDEHTEPGDRRAVPGFRVAVEGARGDCGGERGGESGGIEGFGGREPPEAAAAFPQGAADGRVERRGLGQRNALARAGRDGEGGVEGAGAGRWAAPSEVATWIRCRVSKTSTRRDFSSAVRRTRAAGVLGAGTAGTSAAQRSGTTANTPSR
jgi:hypothetical protein